MYAAREFTALVWLTPGLVILFLTDFLTLGTQVAAFGILSAAFGIWAFLVHGGPQVSAAGIFSGASAVFVGYSSVWWVDYLNSNVPPELLRVTFASYFATVLMYFIFWWDTRLPIPVQSRNSKASRWAVTLGITLSVLALTAHAISPQWLQYYTEDAAFVGITLTAIGLTGKSGSTRLFSFRTALLVVLVFWFVLVAFDGFGRLPVLGLLAAVGIVFSMRQKTRSLKLLALVAIPVFSLLLTTFRLEQFGTSASSDRANPDSDVGGIWTFARLTMSSGHELSWGETFWAAATIWIPREWWPEKPQGLGTVLTALLEPQLLPAGHSMVATVFGEWFWNFGWLGIFISIPIMGAAIRWLDRRRIILASDLSTNRTLLLGALVVIAIATITDFVWSGSHTFAARMLLRTAILVGLLMLLGSARKRESINHG